MLYQGDKYVIFMPSTSGHRHIHWGIGGACWAPTNHPHMISSSWLLGKTWPCGSKNSLVITNSSCSLTCWNQMACSSCKYITMPWSLTLNRLLEWGGVLLLAITYEIFPGPLAHLLTCSSGIHRAQQSQDTFKILNSCATLMYNNVPRESCPGNRSLTHNC